MAWFIIASISIVALVLTLKSMLDIPIELRPRMPEFYELGLVLVMLSVWIVYGLPWLFSFLHKS